jgi:hypothetical protein
VKERLVTAYELTYPTEPFRVVVSELISVRHLAPHVDGDDRALGTPVGQITEQIAGTAPQPEASSGRNHYGWRLRQLGIVHLSRPAPDHVAHAIKSSGGLPEVANVEFSLQGHDASAFAVWTLADRVWCEIQEWPIQHERITGGVGAQSRGVGSLCGFPQLSIHDARLSTQYSVLADQQAPLNSNHDQGEHANRRGGDNRAGLPRLGRRLTIYLTLSFGGFLVSLRGWLSLDRGRCLISAAWIPGGFLLSCCGAGLSLASLAVPHTCGGWL